MFHLERSSCVRKSIDVRFPFFGLKILCKYIFLGTKYFIEFLLRPWFGCIHKSRTYNWMDAVSFLSVFIGYRRRDFFFTTFYPSLISTSQFPPRSDFQFTLLLSAAAFPRDSFRVGWGGKKERKRILVKPWMDSGLTDFPQFFVLFFLGIYIGKKFLLLSHSLSLTCV